MAGGWGIMVREDCRAGGRARIYFLTGLYSRIETGACLPDSMSSIRAE
jgi:hypothetical protein